MGRKRTAPKSSGLPLFDVTKNQISDVELQTAYHLHLEKCTDCKKNCSKNPSCLHGLGESYWLNSSKTSSHKETAQKLKAQIDSKHRQKGELIGLFNLGATCYVNSYLQLWFHNIHFRNSIYALNKDIAFVGNTSCLSLCGELQLIFGLLQNSLSSCVDPTSFIKCLGLSTDLQQDAQEFSKLFMNLLESTPELSNVIQNQFSGKYTYITKCSNCAMTAETDAKFYELDLNIYGHKDLKSCLLEFFKQEPLEGDNQYFCSGCNSNQNAVRQIVLKRLPATLNIQLLRFVYDRSFQKRYKITTNLSFPNQLDFSSVIGSQCDDQFLGELNYQLTAVLLHRGPSASSGHFVANILDSTSNSWYEFNDETVIKLKNGKKLNLNSYKSEDPSLLNGVEPALKKSKICEGYHSSKDVYMLVYSKVSSQSNHTLNQEMPPSHIQQLVEKQNKKHKSESVDLHLSYQSELNKQHDLDRRMKKFVELLLAESEYFEWVPTSILRQFLKPTISKQIELALTSTYVCSHGKINVEKLPLLKRIPKEAAEIIYANETGFVHLTDDMLCRHCVFNRQMLSDAKNQLDQDHLSVCETMITFESNQRVNSEDCYYVGRHSMHMWKSMALQKFLDAYSLAPVEKSHLNNDFNESDKLSDSLVSNEEFLFNSDAFCHHNQLTTEEKRLRIVPDSVWKILTSYFPESGVFKVGSRQFCRQCTLNVKKVEENLHLRKTEALDQKKVLYHLYTNRNRPSRVMMCGNFASEKCINERFYIVPGQFVSQWRKFVRHPKRYNPVKGVNNTVFLCQHKKLLFNPLNSDLFSDDNCDEGDSTDPYPGIVFLWEREWDFIEQNFEIDYTIRLQRRFITPCSVVLTKLEIPFLSERNSFNLNELQLEPAPARTDNTDYLSSVPCSNPDSSPDMACSSGVEFRFKPQICVQCMDKLVKKEQNRLRKYEDAEIYIKSMKSCKEFDEHNFSFMESAKRRPQLKNGRSLRTRHVTRGVKKIRYVCSNMTLKDLKVKVMGMFSVPLCSQHLYLDDTLLTDDSATLESLSILPGSTLILAEDLLNSDYAWELSASGTISEHEVGFLGTSLLGNS